MSLKQWPSNERPREKLGRTGVQSLTDAELIALLFGSGRKGKDAVAFSREVLTQSGGLQGLMGRSYSDLRGIRGLGPARVCLLLAAKEMVLRCLRQKAFRSNVICDPSAVLDYLDVSMGSQKTETFRVLFLDRANQVKAERDLSIGTVDRATVYPREVVKAALEYYATAVLLVHNHPSGEVEPSTQDRELTQQVRRACATVDIEVLDHLIIGGGTYYSFRECGLL